MLVTTTTGEGGGKGKEGWRRKGRGGRKEEGKEGRDGERKGEDGSGINKAEILWDRKEAQRYNSKRSNAFFAFGSSTGV